MYVSEKTARSAAFEARNAADHTKYRPLQRIDRFRTLAVALGNSIRYGGLQTIQHGCIERRLSFAQLQELCRSAKDRLPPFWVDEDGGYRFRRPSKQDEALYAEADLAYLLTPADASGYI